MKMKRKVTMILAAVAMCGSALAGFGVTADDAGWDIYNPGGPGYRYGPSFIINDDGSIDVWMASPGFDSFTDVIRHKKSTDGGATWFGETVAMTPTIGSVDALWISDPGAIKFGGYYYLGYTSSTDPTGIVNDLFVARSTSTTGPWEKWNGSGWGGAPSGIEPIVEFTEGTPYWGCGEPSFVVKDGTLYIYYTWDASEGVTTRVATADATNPNWPLTMTFHGTAVKKVAGSDSVDVKYVVAEDKFIAINAAARLGPDSYIQVWTSSDGLAFTLTDNVTTNLQAYCHNVGLSGDETGHINSNEVQFIAYPYGPTWGAWPTRFHPATLSVEAETKPADDMVLYRAGEWFVHETEAAPDYLDPSGTSAPPATVDSTTAWGFPTDTPMVGDVNGDGIDDVVVTRDDVGAYGWYAGHTDATGQIGSQVFPSPDSAAGGFGTVGGNDGNFLADVTGNGADDAITINGGFNWYCLPSGAGGLSTGGALQGPHQYGLSGLDQPIVGDWNGDGSMDVGVYRTGDNTGAIFTSFTGGGVIGAGGAGPVGQIGGGTAGSSTNDTLLIGNLNGDAFDDAVMVRQDGAGLIEYWGLINDGTGNLNFVNPGTTLTSFGNDGTDIPMLADVNGDGRDDLVVNRNGAEWYSAFTGVAGVLGGVVNASANFGIAGDVPMFGEFSEPVVEVILGNLTLDLLSGGNDLTLTWATSIGTDYTVEIKTNLTDLSWTSNSAAVGTGGDVTVTTAVDQAKTFYRVSAP